MFSVFELFKIGIGPSSSHTVGPMRAAACFIETLACQTPGLQAVAEIRAHLFGSLALTGRGHATDRAVMLGLSGYQPNTVPSEVVQSLPDLIKERTALRLPEGPEIRFVDGEHLLWHYDEALPRHPNAMRFEALDAGRRMLLSETYYSVGGGFVISDQEADAGEVGNQPPREPFRYPFKTAAELLKAGKAHDLKIWQVMLENETAWRSEEETRAGVDVIWSVMKESIERGCAAEGELPGGLHVRRRAAGIRKRLDDERSPDGLEAIDWLSLFALAVNEENAMGNRVVTAPTNGAAGVIPAVLAYYERFFDESSREGIQRFLLTATAIGALYKHNASLSAAEVGCQGEVGVASSMAAAGLAEVMGGSNEQIENAAEIAMEHHLGMTCDPVGGLVQVPCIERNAVGAVKAVNAARLAVLHGDGTHRVALDRVIAAMRQTGVDMAKQYKETSLGGLAVHVGVPEC